MQQPLTQYQSQYYAWLLTRRVAGDSVESLASTLVDSQVDLNPHQVDAALFACRNPLSRGVLADEVGLGKTIEAGLVISQRWAERRRKILIIVPANLRKQWHQELQDKFGLQGLILEAKATTRSASRIDRIRSSLPLARSSVPTSSPSPRQTMSRTLTGTWSSRRSTSPAQRLQNQQRHCQDPQGGVVARSPKVLLTATPLQNSLLELYGLVSFIDDRVFGDLDSFRSQFTGREQAFNGLRDRLAPSASVPCAKRFSRMCHIRRARPSSKSLRPQAKSKSCPDSSLITCAVPT